MNNYYYNEDKSAIAVLISPGYGTGWSTDNLHGINLALDKKVINYWLNSSSETPLEEVRNELANLGYYELNLYGWSKIKLYWVRRGTTFRIVQYDGYEKIELFDEKDWVTVR